MGKKEIIKQLKEAGFSDLLKYDKDGKITSYELGYAIDKYCSI